MRVLLLTNYYPPYEVGGYEQLCHDVAARLAARGHSCAVLTSVRGAGQGDGAAQAAVDDAAGIFRLLRIQPDPDARLGPAGQFFLTRRAAEAHNRTVFQRIVQHFQPDVVFIWNLQGLSFELALDAEALPGVATAYWLAGYSPAAPDPFWRYWTQTPATRTYLQGAKALLARLALAQLRREGKPVRPQLRHVAVVSDYLRQQGQVTGTLPPHTEVIYNGVEIERFFRPVAAPDAPSPSNVLVAGRVSHDKGVHVAVEAAAKLWNARPAHDFQLLIAGSGPAPFLAQLQRAAAQADAAEAITFLGWLPRAQMPALMQRCHVLLLPTIHQEPFARVTLEAMAAGLAVVGTETGGTGEILQGEVNGLICKAEDSDDLAHQLGRLLDDPALRHRLATHGQRSVLAHFSLEEMVEKVEGLLHRAIVEQGVRQPV